jgi:hypothetical protein
VKPLAILFGASCIGAMVFHYVSAVPRADAVLAIDTSVSVARNCERAEQAARSLAAQKGMEAGSVLSVLVMGSAPADPEPTLVFSEPIPTPPTTVYGRDNGAFAKAQQDYFGKIRRACETAPESRRSPILRMVARAIEDLRRTCPGSAHCFLTVKTDLEEDVDPDLTAAIRRAAKDRSAVAPHELVGTLDNAGIDVTFCGVAEVGAMRGIARRLSPEALAGIWKALFTHPNLVSVQPFCTSSAGAK